MTADAHHQQQFLDVIDRDEAERRFRAALDLRPLEPEVVLLSAALGRVLANDELRPLECGRLRGAGGRYVRRQ
jgi:hypothetical protein